MEASKKYNAKEVFNNVNLEISDNEFVLLIGENGSGKSTLLKSISGLIYPEKENMIYKNNYNAYLPEKFSLPKNLTVKEFVSFLEDFFKIDLSYYVNNLVIPNLKIKELSKGNLQKLGIISIIATKLSTIILDEPTEGMDVELKKKFIDILKILHKEGKTIIISTHNPKDYNSFKCRKIFMKDGNIYENN
jgi:ABC-2 type transport system ATP-binding protein